MTSNYESPTKDLSQKKLVPRNIAKKKIKEELEKEDQKRQKQEMIRIQKEAIEEMQKQTKLHPTWNQELKFQMGEETKELSNLPLLTELKQQRKQEDERKGKFINSY